VSNSSILAGQIEVAAVIYGLTIGTIDKQASISYPWLDLFDSSENGGKSNALEERLERAAKKCSPSKTEYPE
jgi:hypothetical protein